MLFTAFYKEIQLILCRIEFLGRPSKTFSESHVAPLLLWVIGSVVLQCHENHPIHVLKMFLFCVIWSVAIILLCETEGNVTFFTSCIRFNFFAICTAAAVIWFLWPVSNFIKTCVSIWFNTHQSTILVTEECRVLHHLKVYQHASLKHYPQSVT